jgi:hypothetical protein
MPRRWNWMSKHFNQILTLLPFLHIGFYTAYCTQKTHKIRNRSMRILANIFE